MKSFSEYCYDMKDISLPKNIDELLESIDINEFTIRPETARIVAFALLAQILSRYSKINLERDLDKKLNLLADQNRYNAYLIVLQIAIDSNDPQLLRKIRSR